jgi:hypothetical protein
MRLEPQYPLHSARERYCDEGNDGSDKPNAGPWAPLGHQCVARFFFHHCHAAIKQSMTFAEDGKFATSTAVNMKRLCACETRMYAELQAGRVAH